jgi:hypothetical protein
VVKPEKACGVKSPGKSAGTISATAKTEFFDLAVKEAEKSYEEFVPTMTVEFTGEECTLPKKLEAKGATAAEVPVLEEESTGRVQKFSQAIAEAAGVTSLKLGENQAFLKGELTEKLSGAFETQRVGITEGRIFPFPITLVVGIPKTIRVTNLGPRLLKLTEIKVTSGPFTLTDSVPCKNGPLLAALENCTFSVVCNTASSMGVLQIEWSTYVTPGGPTTGHGIRPTSLSC